MTEIENEKIPGIKVGTRRMLAVLTAVIALAYAWMASHMMELRLVFPNSIGQAVWYEGGKMTPLRKLSQLGPTHYLAWSRISAQARKLPQDLKQLGPFARPVNFVVMADHPEFFSLAEGQVELGLETAGGENEILKAVLQAWLMQSGSKFIQGSQLRMEVASDVLIGITRGEFALGNLQYPKIGNWLKSVQSFSASCGSPWLPSRMNVCGKSNTLNPLSLRPLIGSIILETFNSLPLLSQDEFAHDWIAALKVDGSQLPKRELPTSILEWRKWVRAETAEIMAVDQLQTKWPTLPILLRQQIEAASLQEQAPLKMDLVFKTTSTFDWKKSTDLAVNGLTAELITPESSTLVPSGVEVTERDQAAIATRNFIWTADDQPTVGEVLKAASDFKRILFIPEFPGTVTKYGGLVAYGTEIFARENRSHPFLHMSRAGLELAVKKHVLSPAIPVANLMDTGKKYSPLLGINEAQWVPLDRAYKVQGAIEAVKWFRSAVATVPQASR